MASFPTTGSVTSTGLGSGIDIEGLISKLVEAEGKVPAEQLNVQETTVLGKLTGFGTLKGALSDFQDSLTNIKEVSSFQVRKTSVTNSTTSTDTYFSVTSTSDAVPAKHEIEVVQLAQAHKLASGDFATANTVVGTGTLNLVVGTSNHTISIDSSNNTLAGIKNEINKVSTSTGVSASILTLDSGSRLVLSSNKPGLNSAITVLVTGDSDGNDTDNSGLSQLASMNLTELQSAQNSIVRIDNATQTVTTSSNQLVNVIEGVTIDLLKADPGNEHYLEVSLDKTAAVSQVENFIEKFNNLITEMNTLTKRGEGDDDNGVLLGDATLRNIESNLRNALHTVVSNVGGYNSLSEMGISTNSTTGLLSLDSDKLSNKIDENFDAVGNLFGGTNGVAGVLDNLVDGYIKADGTITTQTDGLKIQLDNITDERQKLEDRLQNLEDRHRTKLLYMDQLVAQLSAVSDRLAQQLDTFVEPLSFKK